MTITVRSEDFRLSLPIPLSVTVAKIVMKIVRRGRNKRIENNELARITESGNFDLDSLDIAPLIKELRACRARFGRFCIVDVESSDGETVRITV